jgi:hypothetical protein
VRTRRRFLGSAGNCSSFIVLPVLFGASGSGTRNDP